jgi:hypothetical protein
MTHTLMGGNTMSEFFINPTIDFTNGLVFKGDCPGCDTPVQIRIEFGNGSTVESTVWAHGQAVMCPTCQKRLVVPNSALTQIEDLATFEWIPSPVNEDWKELVVDLPCVGCGLDVQNRRLWHGSSTRFWHDIPDGRRHHCHRCGVGQHLPALVTKFAERLFEKKAQWKCEIVEDGKAKLTGTCPCCKSGIELSAKTDSLTWVACETCQIRLRVHPLDVVPKEHTWNFNSFHKEVRGFCARDGVHLSMRMAWLVGRGETHIRCPTCFLANEIPERVLKEAHEVFNRPEVRSVNY